MIDTDQYTYRAEWSMEDLAWVATVAELPSMSWIAQTKQAALAGLAHLVKATVAQMAASREPVPAPGASP